MKPVLVYGAGDFGQVIRDLVAQCGYPFAGFIDDITDGPEVLGTYASVRRTHLPEEHAIAIAIGYRHLAARWQVYRRVCADGYATPALIHPRAYVRDPGAVGAGAFIMAGAIVDVGATVGELAVLWPGSNVSHHCAVGANTFLSPGAIVCGFTRVGHGCFLGAGAVVVDHMEVPPAQFIKAGTVYSASTRNDPAVAFRMVTDEP
ncbi:MAG: hypothetical protein RMJ43_13885 [Chloroherpetonaceae bacterium]|nr:hypothetical protein [Chthonomonadaceae bacterium]MDW8208920.1 hypothetical protein [Chloroherpetonaceae bacterium]